jgi:two-component system, sensor histidine kinase and response regulator
MSNKTSVEEFQKKIDGLEAKLRKIEAERNSILDNIPFPAWIKDREGRFIHVNQPYVEQFRLIKDGLLSKTVFDVFPYELAQVYHQEDQKVIEQGKTIYFQTKRENEWFSTVKSPVFSSSGEIIGTTGFERNINDNIETLNSLRKERDLLQALMENSPDLIYFKDTKSRFVRINVAKTGELGVKHPHDAIGKSDYDYYDKERADLTINDEQTVLNTGIPSISTEEKITSLEGQETWLSTTKSPIRNDKGEITGLLGISRDITNQKTIIHTLNKERDFLQVLMDYIPYTIYFKDLECRFTKINKAQANLLGIEKPEDAIGKTDFDFFDSQTAQSAFEDEQKILSTGQPMLEKVELLKDAEGNSSWVSATKIPVKNTNGNVTGLVGISIDITEKRRAEEKLREAKEKAEESDKLKTAFLANMSHEIRTPMNGIIGFSNLLRNPGLSEDERNEFLSHITSCGSTLLNLIDDIIDISKIEAGQIKIRIAETSVNDVLDELRESFEASIVRDNKNTVKLICNKTLEKENSVVFTDPFRLRQVISNLVGNALKFTFKGFIEFGYNLEPDETLKFYVQDTGIGIPKDKQEIIFERFGQVLDSNFFINHKGTGLGLAISNNLVKLLGGRMWVDSEPGKGSTFYFTIPYNKIDNVLPGGIESKNGNEKNLFLNKTILIAEDEEINYLYFKHILKESGANIIWVKNGVEAVNAVKTNPDIALVLMDCKMPLMDGYVATKEIKSLFPSLPIIAQTAFAMAEEQERSAQAGCDAYISKPIKVQELFKNLNKYLK